MRYETNFDKVVKFHEAFACYRGNFNKPAFPDEDLLKLRVDLIDEEFIELKDAIAARDLVEVADALTDILYVVYGFGDVMGIELDETFREVHRSNMSKLGADGKPVYRDDGKVLKGPNYSKPDLKSVLGVF